MTFERYRQDISATLRLGGPLILAQLAQVSVGFVDAVMAGRLSARDLAAIAIGANLFWPISFGWAAVLISISPTVAHLYGAGDRDAIGHSVRQGLWLAVAMGIAGFLSLRAAPHLLAPIGVSPELIPITTGFLHTIACGVPGLCFFQALRSYSEGISHTRPIMYTSVFALVANIVGDYIFMYGKLGMPRLGAVGCGVSSAIVLWVNALIMLGYVLTHKKYEPDRTFSRFEFVSWQQIRALMHLGAPMSASWFMEASLFSVAALLIATLGTTAVAGHQIALNVASLTFMVPLGISMATTVRVGQAMGRKDRTGARIAGFAGISLAAGFMAMAALCISLIPYSITSIYTKDEAVRQMGVALLYMAAVFQISDGLQVAGAGALRGLKDSKFPMLITFIAYWVIGMPLGYLLAIRLGGGAKAMWVGIICGLTTAATLLNARFYLVTRRICKSQ